MQASQTPEKQFDDLERLRSGDKATFTRLVAEYGPRMLAFARRFLPREQDAQDALQDAFLSAYRSISTFDGRALLSTWLQRIVINACLMRLRTQRRRPERSLDSLLPTFIADGHQTRSTPKWNADPASQITQEHRAQLVRDCLDELPDQYRAVILLRDIEGISTLETAAALGITEDAVKTRLHRARQALRTLLEPFFADSGSDR